MAAGWGLCCSCAGRHADGSWLHSKEMSGCLFAACAGIAAADRAWGCVGAHGLQRRGVTRQQGHAALWEKFTSNTQDWFVSYKQGLRVFMYFVHLLI